MGVEDKPLDGKGEEEMGKGEERKEEEEEPEVIAPRKICRKCQTGLESGKNWSAYKEKKGDYMCNSCWARYQRDYKHGTIFTIEKAKNRERIKTQKIEEFEILWNKPDYADMTPAMRFGKTFIDGRIRHPQLGFIMEEMLTNIYPEDLEFDLFSGIDDYLRGTKLRGHDKTQVKSHLIEVLKIYEAEIREGKKQEAINKLLSLIKSANNMYDGQEEITALPPYDNPETGQKEHRYYLLSHRPELEARIDHRRGARERSKDKDIKETIMVDKHILESRSPGANKDAEGAGAAAPPPSGGPGGGGGTNDSTGGGGGNNHNTSNDDSGHQSA